MDKQKECDITIINVHQMKEVEEQYQLERARINAELAQKKEDEDQINKKLMSFSYFDTRIEQIRLQIKNLERWDPDKVELNLAVSSVPRTTGVYCLTGKDDQKTVRPDLKRCQKRLVKKGKMDINYLKEIQEEHISSMKSCEITYSGTQELSDMIESMVQRIQHGNKKRADEMKIYQELSNFIETKECYIAPEPHPHWYTYTLQHRSKRYIDYDRYRLQHRLSILLDYIEILKREQIEGQARVGRHKAELQYVRKKINYLYKKLENLDSKILKAYKHANELGGQKKKIEAGQT